MSMSDEGVSFAGSIPAEYDARLVPMFFEPFAQDLAARVPAGASRVLEVAAGTGVVSRALLARLGPDASLVVTDLQRGMLDIAHARIGDDPRVEIRQADAMALPFADHQFDVVVCQFGVMFFADRLAGVRELRRVLAPDGVLLINTWGSLSDNPIARIAHEEVARALPDDPPPFLTVPFGLHDADAVTALLHEAGFTYVQSSVVDLTGRSHSAHGAAWGLLCGSPMYTQLQERGVSDPRRLVDTVAGRLTREGGFAPMRLPMRALVFAAQ
ncbi:class I SAM-dependent methyltransferase [Luteitalea sp.]